MVAIVDSGSTKSDWVILDDFKKFSENRNHWFQSQFYQQRAYCPEIEKNTSLISVKNSITRIFFMVQDVV
jgi:hypothetical protein